MNLKLTVI